MAEKARLRVFIGPRAECGPRLVVNLVVDHPGLRLPVRDLHGQQELHLPACFVEDVRHVVLVLRNAELAVPELAGRATDGSPLELVHHRPDGDAAVHHVLPLVAGVVPSAGDVELVVASRALQAGHRFVAGVGMAGRGLLGDVAGGPRPLLLASVRQCDLDAAALVIEKPKRVDLQLAIDVARDIEGVADVVADPQDVPAPGRCEAGEVHDMNVVAGGGVVSDRLRFAGRDGVAGRPFQLPFEGRLQLDFTVASFGKPGAYPV